MIAQAPRLYGEEWQDWANKLLTCHYGPTNYQKVPDNDKGDCGIEGFCIKNGHAYQAYGCEGEPLKTNDRYAKQRNKMTDDIAKFIKNRTTLQRIFGSVKISRWVLLVPYYDSKEIVIHAANKTAEVVAAGLPYVTVAFRVAVCHEDDFTVERDTLIRAGATTLQLSAPTATTAEVTAWVGANDALASTLEVKLLRLPTLRSAADRTAFHERVLKWHLEGQTILRALRTYPDVYEKVVKAKSHRENFLVMSAVIGGTPEQILASSLQDLRDALRNEVRELHSFSAESLAYEAVADWLLRCPLDFPTVAANG